LFHGLTAAEDDFREALTERAVMVDIGEAEVLKRQRAQTSQCIVGGKTARLMVVENFSNLILSHTKRNPAFNTWMSALCNILTDVGEYRGDHEKALESLFAKSGIADRRGTACGQVHNQVTG